MKVVFSLTVIPPRFGDLTATLESLLAQDLDDFEVRLYIPKHFARFPEYQGERPDVPEGVVICQPDSDYGPASKLLHALKDFENDPDQVIIYCDDDQIYQSDWARKLLNASKKHPDCAICARGRDLEYINGDHLERAPEDLPRAELMRKALDFRYMSAKVKRSLGMSETKPSRAFFRRSGYVDVVMGVGGVLVKPRFFNDTVFDVPQVARFVDDIWLSANLCINGVKAWGVAQIPRSYENESDPSIALLRTTFDGNDRKALDNGAIRYAQEAFGIWPPISKDD